MTSKSVTGVVQFFDIYKRVPKEIGYKTYTGAFISIIALSFIVLLTISEIKIYQNKEYQTEMKVQNERPDNLINVSFQVTFHNAPCHIMHLDAEINENNISELEYGQIIKGNSRSKPTLIDPNLLISEQELINAINNHSCRIKASFKIDMVFQQFQAEQNFSFSINDTQNSKLIKTKKYMDKINMAHTFDYLYVGESSSYKALEKEFPKAKSLNQYRQYTVQNTQASLITYYVHVLSTTYMSEKNIFNAYEYTFTHSELKSQQQMVMMHFNFSPLQMTSHQVNSYMKYQSDFFILIVQLCAIIGGVLSISGLIDSIVNKSVNHVMKKYNMGKLS